MTTEHETEEDYEDGDGDDELDCPVEISPNVEAKVYENWKNLKRVAISKFENGKQVRIHSFTVRRVKGSAEPSENVDEVIERIHRHALLQSKEESREVQCKVQLFSLAGGTSSPPYVIFRACYPGVKGNPNLESILDSSSATIANVHAQSNAVALQVLMTLFQKMLEREEAQIERIDRAHNREHSLLMNIASNQTAVAEREQLAHNTLNIALEQMVSLMRFKTDLAIREVTLDAEVQKEVKKQERNESFVRELGAGFKNLLPALQTIAMVKLGADADIIQAMMSGSGGPILADDDVPPPPPSSPPSPAPVAAAPPASNGANHTESIAYCVGRVAVSLSESQWDDMRSNLNDDQMTRLKNWLKPGQNDAYIIGAMLQVVNSPDGREIVSALAQTCDEHQGIWLDKCLGAIYANAGQTRPPSVVIEDNGEEIIEVEASPTPRRSTRKRRKT